MPNKKLTKDALLIKGVVTEIQEWINNNRMYYSETWQFAEDLSEYLDKIQKEVCEE